MEILAIIPARGGSKGLPNKNILPLNGHPLIAYSIAAAKQTPEVTRVICTTDYESIAEVARKYGAETPFLRPASLAADKSPDIDAFAHALRWLKEHENYTPDIIIQLRPTSPIRFVKDISRGIDIIKNNLDIDSVRGVSEPHTTPYKMWTIGKDGLLEPLLKIEGNAEPFNTARQLLPEVWAQNGTIEIIRTCTILEKKSMTGNKIYPLITDSCTYVDIDGELDLIYAELMMKKVKSVSPA